MNITSAGSYPFWTHLRIQRFMLGECQHEIKVTYLGGGVYGCRVFTNGVLNAENRCRGKDGISAACRDLLRWESKMGNWSDFSDKSRRGYKKLKEIG